MRKCIALPLAAVLVGVGASPALAAVKQVDDNKVQCPGAAFTTIQAAVDAANPGDQIQVCDGTYREQVRIAKDNIDLVSKSVRGATISPPAGTLAAPEALVHIDGASRAQVRRFRIVGPGSGTADSLRWGVLVDGQHAKVAARVTDNLIKDIRDSEAAANESGVGVQVGSFRGSVSRPGRATVLNNEITSYQKGGVVVNESGSFANVGTNVIRGLGLQTSPVTPVPAQQGIQIGFDAAANVYNNTISENKYATDNGDPNQQYASYGILIVYTPTAKDPFGTAKSRVKTNTVFNNDVGILVLNARNWLFETNKVFGNGDPSTAAQDGGIAVYEDAAPNGNGNRFNKNDARSNDGLDCTDETAGPGTAGTGNVWIGNRGIDDAPAAICAP